MPTREHEDITQLFRDYPALAAELLSEALHQPVPQFDTAEFSETSLHSPAPAERRADAIVLLKRKDQAEPALGVVVEVQRRPDPRKRTRWLHYWAALADRFNCPTCLLVIATTPAVARWAASPIETGQPGVTFIPLVAGPDAIPPITDPERVLRQPGLALLSARAHGKTATGLDIARAFQRIVPRLEEHDVEVYFDYLEQALSPDNWLALEDEMAIFENYQFRGPTYLRMKKEAEQEGRHKGRQEGLAAGKVEALLTILRARGLELTDDQRSRIIETASDQTLDRWLERAVSIDRSSDLFLSD